METNTQINDNLPEPEKRANWDIAFGLQKSDSLEPSSFAKSLADKHIEGQISFPEFKKSLDDYYNDPSHPSIEREADLVAEAIYEILATPGFHFNLDTLKDYHRHMFQELDPNFFHPGEFRTISLTKKETVLGGASIALPDPATIESTLIEAFNAESKLNYLGLSRADRAVNLAGFTSRIWRPQPFFEGNTCVVVVFIEKYLRSIGYRFDAEIFKEHSREFHDALVIANYPNTLNGTPADPKKLIGYFNQMLEA